MIPKIIHYIWFGGKPYPEKIKFCIESWKKFLPEYEFKLWNEDTFDIENSCTFVKQAFEHKKWAFVSDYVRIWALKEYGGIYLDTDIEIRQPLDRFLNERMVLGTDELGYLTALMASEPNHEFWDEILKEYQGMSFLNSDGTLNQTVNNTYIQDKLATYGYKVDNVFQRLANGTVIYPDDWFHAVDHMSGIQNITPNTYAIHWHTLTWLPKQSHFKRFIRVQIIARLIGGRNASKLFNKLSKLK